jgi:bla regulator protein blaR1
MPDVIQTVALWVGRASWQVLPLIGLVLFIQALLGSKLPARWRHGLWWIVVVKLLAPGLVQSPVSLFNVDLLRSPAVAGSILVSGVGDAAVVATWAWIWLIGVLVVLAAILREHGRLARAVLWQRPVTDASVLNVLEDCKARMGIHTPLIIIETPWISSPALFGWIRPRLLLPRGTLESLDADELRHVFLHELAHLQRHDIAFGWLLALTQALHWFNPVVWFALHRVRVDRELATDELALHHAELHENRSYGATIVKLLERFSSPAPLPAIAAILEDRAQMSNRIRQIARFGSVRTSPVLGAILAFLLVFTFLTDGKSGTREPGPGEGSAATMLPGP